MVEIESDRFLGYLDNLRRLRTPHIKIQEKLEKHIQRLEDSKLHLKQVMLDLDYNDLEISNELKEMQEVYSNMPILSIHLPNLKKAQKSFNTLQQKEITILVDIISDIIEVSSDIKERIVTKPVIQEQPLRTEQEKIAITNLQSKDLFSLKDIKSKAIFNSAKKRILSRIKSEEDKIFTDNISIEMYGEPIENLEWTIGKNNLGTK